MFSRLNKIIKSYIIKHATQHRAVDIIEVRTKEYGLLSVKTETVLKLINSFFLPITLIAIHTDLVNRDGIKVGKMDYIHPIRLKSKSETIITTQSEISSITSIFQALTNLLAQPIYMRSIGTATLKFLWWTVEIEVDDVFEIHPSKLKIRKDETEEERVARLQREEERKARMAIEREERKQQEKERSALRKETILKRRHKENYIPKEERNKATIIEEQTENTEHIILESNERNEIEITSLALDTEINVDNVELKENSENPPSISINEQ